MDAYDKIKHFVTLINQFNKRPSPQTRKTLEEIMFRYQIEPIGKPNKYGAQEYCCGKVNFRTFRGKLVNSGLSGLTFFKVIEAKPDKVKTSFEEYCKRMM